MLDHEPRFRNIIQVAAEQATKDMNANAIKGVFTPMSLCYKSSTCDTDGQLAYFAKNQVPTDWIVAKEDLLNCGIPYDKFFALTQQHSTNLPILAANF